MYWIISVSGKLGSTLKAILGLKNRDLQVLHVVDELVPNEIHTFSNVLDSIDLCVGVAVHKERE